MNTEDMMRINIEVYEYTLECIDNVVSRELGQTKSKIEAEEIAKFRNTEREKATECLIKNLKDLLDMD